jgi:hypothetical protein
MIFYSPFAEIFTALDAGVADVSISINRLNMSTMVEVWAKLRAGSCVPAT